MRRVALLVIVAVVLVIGGCGGGGGGDDEPTIGTPTSSSSQSASEPIVVDVVGGEPHGGVRTVSVARGEIVVLQVSSDRADEVHVHGYDVKAAVKPGVPAELQFTARIPGVFDVELEGLGRQILKLEVGAG